MLAAEEMVMEENRRIKAEGISIGRNQGKCISIINMLKMGFPIETISKISETSEDEIKKIAKIVKIKNEIKLVFKYNFL